MKNHFLAVLHGELIIIREQSLTKLLFFAQRHRAQREYCFSLCLCEKFRFFRKSSKE